MKSQNPKSKSSAFAKASADKQKRYFPKDIESKWPHKNFTSSRRLSASRSRGAILRGKQEISRYFPDQIERKWQRYWKEGLYKFSAKGRSQPKADEPLAHASGGKGKYYNLVELPYPSGDLHLGHWFAFVPADAHARYMRMQGYSVFFPNGFDAFGLPAENAAITRGIHPKDWTYKNIKLMKKQFETMGTMIDWSTEVITSNPSYYKWNQWIFLKMFEKGIAYRGKALSNWCPVDQTVLANEHIENGKCWRCSAEVVQKEVEQWFLKITDYAERLIWHEPKSENVDWPKEVREGQNNWIGRSEGLLIEFKIQNSKFKIEVFTTKPETTDGATFLVVAPEHEFVQKLLDKNFQFPISNFQYKEIKNYVEEAKKKTEMERKEDRTKSGKFSGAYAVNPVTGKKIPIWISDYVLAGYGTGAIMAVPDADERDREFAQKFNLPIVETSFKAKPNGKKTVNYHLRDWSISRQRYWGTPIPIVYCKNCARGPATRFPPASARSRLTDMRAVGSPSTPVTPRKTVEIDGEEYAMIPVPYKDLPVELPYKVDYTPKGKPPLASAKNWLNTKCPKCGGSAKRDAETLDTFFDSAWYYYRYVSPDYRELPFDKLKVENLMPVDIYFGGSEHTLGHTLYARFFTKFFKDIGLVSFDEFAKKRAQHGVILGPDGNRMSKSKGNVVNPDDVVKEFGTDTVRLYLCFMMPYEATAPWSPGAIYGVYRFLKRVWDLQFKIQNSKFKINLSQGDLFQMHRTIKKVGEDLKLIQFNTAVSSLMSWLNYLSAKNSVSKEEYETFLKLLAPFAPHIAEELFQFFRTQKSKLKSQKFESIHLQSWPKFEEKYLAQDQIQIVVQVNGKLRGQVTIDSSHLTDQKTVEEKAKSDQKISKYLASGVKKVVYVEGKIINFVTDGK